MTDRFTKFIYEILLSARWLLVVFYAGLGLALAAYAYVFAHKVYAFILKAGQFDEVSALLSMLGLIDSALVAGLVVMVIQSGFGSFLATDAQSEGNKFVDFGALKTKFIATIAAIASIDFLEAILDIKNYDNGKLVMIAVLMGVILFAVLVYAIAEKLTQHKE
ncbi:MAG: YqhA family protein [Alphaproteobacteria bacterium]|nr:YqhA family protein [Alphaproteobacteria bacterium]